MYLSAQISLRKISWHLIQISLTSPTARTLVNQWDNCEFTLQKIAPRIRIIGLKLLESYTCNKQIPTAPSIQADSSNILHTHIYIQAYIHHSVHPYGLFLVQRRTFFPRPTDHITSFTHRAAQSRHPLPSYRFIEITSPLYNYGKRNPNSNPLQIRSGNIV